MNYAELIQNNGGFSLNHRNESPTSGYMVSLEGFERIIRNYRDYPIEDLNYLCKNFRLSLADTVESRWFGGWVDGDDLYLDASINVQFLETALEFARLNKQLAIYDVVNQTSIKVN